jgi:succinate dehydrogenase / fumarate reductase cytochrome b subunit
MALTGLLFFGWLMAHMAGNLKIFLGQEHFNEYAHWLREVGAPAVPHGTVLWISRIVLLLALALHFTAAIQLTRMNWGARPEKYQALEPQQAGLPQRTMIYSGLLVLLYVVYHLLHLTTGSAHHEFDVTNPYGNVVAGFQVLPVALVYMAANVLLGVHLYHGLWSLFQSLGWNHESYNPLRRVFAVAFSIILAGGFLSVPLAVLTGVVS